MNSKRAQNISGFSGTSHNLLIFSLKKTIIFFKKNYDFIETSHKNTEFNRRYRAIPTLKTKKQEKKKENKI